MELEYGLSPAEFRNYFKHILGINLMNVWLSEHRDFVKANEKHNEIQLDLFLSQQIFLVAPSKRERFYGLACECNILDWMKRIQWARIFLNPFERSLTFIAQRMDGDKQMLPDIEAFALTIKVDHLKKLKLFKNERYLNIKEVFFQEGEMGISRPKVKKVPLIVLTEPRNEDFSYFNREELSAITNSEDIKRGIVQRKNSIYSAIYQGSVAPIIDSSLARLTQKFSEQNIADQAAKFGDYVVSSDYLKEFAKKEYEYGDWYEQNLSAIEEDRHKNNQKFASMWE